MSADESPQQPISPAPGFVSPPMQPGIPMMAAPQSKWPTVIGIIAIIWAAFGLLGGVCGLGGMFMARSMPTNFPGAPGMSMGVSPMMLPGFFIGLILKACLLALGIGLLKRRFWAPQWVRIWAVVEMLGSVIGLVLGYLAQQHQFAAMARQPGMQQMPPAFFEGMAVFSVGCGLLVAWALPVFMLIWFSRDKIKEEVATWESPVF
jgi:hypothetical protein